MADSRQTFTLRPAAVEIMPADEVATITARYDELINSLEKELVVALEEADAAEARLREHPAAHVIDDDFEAFVIWATEAHVVDIRRDAHAQSVLAAAHDVPPPRPAPRPEPVPYIVQQTEPPIDVESRVTPPFRPPGEPPTVFANPVVPPAPEAAPPRTARSTGRTTVVTRPGSTPPPPAPAPPAPPAAPAVDYVAPPAAAPAPAPAEAPAEKFWDDGRTNRSSRVSKPQRAGGRIASLPSTLMLQAGAVIVIVALLVLKLG